MSVLGGKGGQYLDGVVHILLATKRMNILIIGHQLNVTDERTHAASVAVQYLNESEEH